MTSLCKPPHVIIIKRSTGKKTLETIAKCVGKACEKEIQQMTTAASTQVSHIATNVLTKPTEGSPSTPSSKPMEDSPQPRLKPLELAKVIRQSYTRTEYSSHDTPPVIPPSTSSSTPVKEITTVPTLKVNNLLEEALDKKMIKYSDAPNNPNCGNVRLTREGHALYKKVTLEKEVNTNQIDLVGKPLQVGMVTIEDSTLIPSPHQGHLVVAYDQDNDQLISVGYMTSQVHDTKKIADVQLHDEKKAQHLAVFTKPYIVNPEDFERDNEMTAFVQDPLITKAIGNAAKSIKNMKPSPYNPTGITEEDLAAMVALKRIEQAEEAIKKANRPSNFLTEDHDKKQAYKLKKAEETRMKQKALSKKAIINSEDNHENN